MEGDMDDFGDIYADVEGYVNAGVSMIPSIRQLYLEDRAKAESSPGDDIDSEDEERLLYERIIREGRSEVNPSIAAAAAPRGSDEKKMPEGLDGGGDGEVAEESNDSDSEDDLRIVLNEEDCNRFVPPQRVGLGNGGLPAGACTNEDADDESMTGTGGDHTSKEYKWTDSSQLPAEVLEQSGPERCGSLKSGFVIPYSQFKYVRSQSAGCLINAKSTGQGYVVPFTSPMTSKGDLDVSGLLAATSCHVGFPVPRNRTIFDISIESFDRKPWRNQGVDITDFFNFGLNEESWKQYCDNMVLFRKQATWMARKTSYGSIRSNQAFDTRSLHGEASAEASLSEVEHLEGGGTAVSNVAKPKGKAIQVEGGSGDRLPSMNVRRPRYQDSDVVIQIPVESSDKDATLLPKENPEHIDVFVPHSDGVYGGNKEAVDYDKKELPESRSTILRDPKEKLRSVPDSSGIVNEKPRKMDVQVFCPTLTSADEDVHSSCPSSSESISEEYENDLSADKLYSPAKRSSLGSVAASDISVGSSYDTSHAERVNDGADSPEPGLYLEEHRSQSDTELCDVVIESDNVHIDLDKIGQNNSDSPRRYCGKLGKRSSCSHHVGEDTLIPSSLEQNKMSKNSESWRFAEKRLSKNSRTEHSHWIELDHTRGNCRRRHSLRERGDCKLNDVKHTEYKIPKEAESGCGMKFGIRKERYRRSIPDLNAFCAGNDWSALHRSKATDDRRWCVKPDVIFGDRYMKRYIEGNDSKRFPYVERNEASQDDFERNVPHGARDRRSGLRRRERYDRNLYIEMDDSQGYVEDDEHWRYSNHRFLDDHTFRGSSNVDGRVWHESSPPRVYDHTSWRSSEMYVGHCGISDAREARFNKQRVWDLLYPCSMDKFSSDRDHYDIGGDRCSIEERGGHNRNMLFSEERKSSHVSQQRDMTEDQVRHQILDDSHVSEAFFSCERIYRHDNGCDKPSLKILHSHSLVNKNGTRDPRKTGSLAKEQNCVRHREAVDGRLNGYEGKPFEKYGDVVYKKKKNIDDKMENFDHTDETSWRKGNPGKRQKMEDHNTHIIHSTVNKVKQCDSGDYGTHTNEEHDGPEVLLDQDDSGLEEGQLVEPEDDDPGTRAKKWDTEETVPVSSTEVRHGHGEEKKHVKDTSSNKMPIEYDNNRILETLAKMEKRRERFKEPITPRKEQEKAPIILSQVMVVKEEVKLERPTRKRRWGAVKSPAA